MEEASKCHVRKVAEFLQFRKWLEFLQFRKWLEFLEFLQFRKWLEFLQFRKWVKSISKHKTDSHILVGPPHHFDIWFNCITYHRVCQFSGQTNIQ